MKINLIKLFCIIIILSGCAGPTPKGVFGSGVKVGFDPRSVGTQIDDPEEKLKITKLAWETKGARSVKNDLKIKEKFNFKQSAKDILITSQLRSALIFNKKISSSNYSIDTYKKKIYIYGISLSEDETKEVINEAKQILDVEDVISSILLVDDLRIQKN